MKLVDSLWKNIRTYRTIREVEFDNLYVGITHKLSLLGVAIYLLYTILTSHSYFIKESPTVSVNAWIEASPVQEQLAKYRQGITPLPWYCDSPKTEYVYSPNFKYSNNTCDLNPYVSEIYNEESMSVAINTYFNLKVKINSEDFHLTIV